MFICSFCNFKRLFWSSKKKDNILTHTYILAPWQPYVYSMMLVSAQVPMRSRFRTTTHLAPICFCFLMRVGISPKTQVWPTPCSPLLSSHLLPAWPKRQMISVFWSLQIPEERLGVLFLSCKSCSQLFLPIVCLHCDMHVCFRIEIRSLWWSSWRLTRWKSKMIISANPWRGVIPAALLWISPFRRFAT